MPIIEAIEAEIIETPLRHTFATAQDQLARQVSRRVEIRLVLDCGRVSRGEATPVAYVTGETPESVVQAVTETASDLIGIDILLEAAWMPAVRTGLPNDPSARAGLEMALHVCHAQCVGRPLWRPQPGAVDRVETDITLSISDDTVDRAIEAAERGFRIFKMKVGGPDHVADLARLTAVQRAVPEATIRIDANQGFNADDAVRFIERTLEAGVNLELVEQPVPKEDLRSLDYVAGRSPVPVFADEAVRTPSDAQRLVSETAVQGINVKIMKSGVAGAMEIAAIAREAGRKLMMGCMLESRYGIAFSLALACGSGEFDVIDLDSHMLLNEDGPNPFFREDGPILYAPQRFPLD